MHPYTAVLAQRQAEELRAYAKEQRLARAARGQDRPNRIVRAMSAVKSAITAPTATPSRV